MGETFKCEHCSQSGVGFDDYGRWLCEACLAIENGETVTSDETGLDDDEDA